MKYRDNLPQLDGELFLTDGGLETELVFHDGIELPAFAAFDLLKDDQGTARLAPVLRALRGARARARAGSRAREPDVASQPPLGGRDRLLPSGARPDQSQGDRVAGADPRELRGRRADGHQRLRGSAGRRLPPEHDLVRGRRAGLSLDDEATALDEGDPFDLGARYAALATALPALNVLGGCCRTDHRHVQEIRDAWLEGSIG